MKYGSVTVTEKEFESYKKETTALTRRFFREMDQENAVVDIFLVGDKFMKKNVLAFPSPKSVPRPDIKGKMLGEIYLNPKYIKNNKESFEFILIHGLLHLLGYDHIRKADRIVMEQKENELLATLFPARSSKSRKRT